MSGDIALFIKDDDTIDLEVSKNDLATDDGLRTAVIASLFTDRRVELEELPVGVTDRRGWWGDVFAEEPGDQIGSRLWLLEREKRTNETLNRAEEYAQEALQWMIDDGVADRVECSASWDRNGALALQILIYQPKETKSYRFAQKWNVESEQEK